MEILVEYNVPLNKLIGICSDGASTMRGVHKGVCTQLERHLRGVREETMRHLIMAQDVHIRRAVDSFHAARGIFTVHCVSHGENYDLLTIIIKLYQSILTLRNYYK